MVLTSLCKVSTQVRKSARSLRDCSLVYLLRHCMLTNADCGCVLVCMVGKFPKHCHQFWCKSMLKDHMVQNCRKQTELGNAQCSTILNILTTSRCEFWHFPHWKIYITYCHKINTGTYTSKISKGIYLLEKQLK